MSDDYERLLAGERPGPDGQLWLGLACALLVVAFVALVVYLAARAT